MLSIAAVLTHEQAQILGIQPYRAKQLRDDQLVSRRQAPPEVRRLLAACDCETLKSLRDHAILSVMLYLRLRREETAGLLIGYFRKEGSCGGAP